jgi:hypothetical protein
MAAFTGLPTDGTMIGPLILLSSTERGGCDRPHTLCGENGLADQRGEYLLHDSRLNHCKSPSGTHANGADWFVVHMQGGIW